VVETPAAAVAVVETSVADLAEAPGAAARAETGRRFAVADVGLP
jgi:hypothetical protein